MKHSSTITEPPASQPGRKRHGCLLAIAGAFALLVIIIIIAAVVGGGGGGSGTGTPSPSSSAASPAASHAASGPGIGSKVRDGKFQFVVIRVSHRGSVGDTSLGLGETAQGRFTVLHVKVTNISSQAQTLDDSSQFVFDASGRKFDASSSADLYANSGNGGGVFLNDINPGNTVRGVILFDLPKSDKAVKAELHDSAFSGGVTVRLSR